MKIPILIVLLIAGIALPGSIAAKEKKPDNAPPPGPIGWLDLHAGSRNLSVSEADFQKSSHRMAQGALLPVFKTKEKRGVRLAQVGGLDLAKEKWELGWVELGSDDVKPLDSYPPDSALLAMLGTPYLDDFIASHTDIARFLVKQTQGPPLLLCYLLAAPLPDSKLAIFIPNQGKYTLGGTLTFPLSEMKAGVTSLELRDLIGDGNDCVITKEPFREQAETYGTNLRIRRVTGGQFQTLWDAPIEFHSLSQYAAKMQILQPPERNIGVPGTVTSGEVTYVPQGRGQQLVWKGKIGFFVFGRDSALDTVNFQKVCPWNGQVFAPLR